MKNITLSAITIALICETIISVVTGFIPPPSLFQKEIIRHDSSITALTAFTPFHDIHQTNAHHSLPKISAHRGASRVAPENTLAAFTKAIEMGADFIEIDVRTTSDGKQVCMHDASLKRTTGLNEKVINVTFQKIKELSAGISFGTEFAQEKVPSLSEVCQLVRRMNKSQSNNVKLYLDCKDITEEEVLTVLNQYQLLDSAIFYGDVNTLKAIRKISPLARLMPPYPGPQHIDEVIAALQPVAFDVAWINVDSSLVTDCHKRGIKVFSDLLDEHDVSLQYSKAIRLGIDLIQTDDVSSVKRSISEYEKKLRNEKH